MLVAELPQSFGEVSGGLGCDVCLSAIPRIISLSARGLRRTRRGLAILRGFDRIG